MQGFNIPGEIFLEKTTVLMSILQCQGTVCLRVLTCCLSCVSCSFISSHFRLDSVASFSSWSITVQWVFTPHILLAPTSSWILFKIFMPVEYWLAVDVTTKTEPVQKMYSQSLSLSAASPPPLSSFLWFSAAWHPSAAAATPCAWTLCLCAARGTHITIFVRLVCSAVSSGDHNLKLNFHLHMICFKQNPSKSNWKQIDFSPT